jgi:excisionase family DNA binding protein
MTLPINETDVKLKAMCPAEAVLRRSLQSTDRECTAHDESALLDPETAEKVSLLSIEDFMQDDIARGSKDLPVKLLLTTAEACRVLAISRSKLYELLGSGNLPSVRIGRSRRIRMRDLEEFVDSDGCEY